MIKNEYCSDICNKGIFLSIRSLYFLNYVFYRVFGYIVIIIVRLWRLIRMEI